MQKQVNNLSNLITSETDSLADGYIKFFGREHFKFFSTKTHVFSGIIGLSAKHETYNYNDYTEGILQALNRLGLVNFSDIENIWLNGKKINYPITDNTQLVNLIQQLYPINNEIHREQVLEFYNHKQISFKFSLSQIEYLIQPIILYDDINDHYYIHWEFGPTTIFESKHPKYFFHFNGNGCNQAGQFAQAAQLINPTSAIQILIDYPNKGLNHILNPRLRAYKTSVKGSINPHIAVYDYLINQHKNGFELSIYAYSYGNLASAKFLPLILLQNPQMQINYVGVGVPATLRQVAHSYSGDNAMWLADTFHLLNESDVYNALKLPNVKALIFNNATDDIIMESAQIHNHSEYIEDNKQLKIIQIIEIKNISSQHEQPFGYQIVLNNHEQYDFNTIFAAEYANFFFKP